MLLTLADEGEFLLIGCDTGSTEAEVGDWVVPFWGPGDDDDGQDVCEGWILGFYSANSEETDRLVEATVEFCDSVPPDAPTRFSKVVEVSAAGPAHLEGAGAGMAATADADVAYRLRLLVDESEQPVRLLIQSWPAEVSAARLLRGASEEAVLPDHDR